MNLRMPPQDLMADFCYVGLTFTAVATLQKSTIRGLSEVSSLSSLLKRDEQVLELRG
jgi:hypothetical protein